MIIHIFSLTFVWHCIFMYNQCRLLMFIRHSLGIRSWWSWIRIAHPAQGIRHETLFIDVFEIEEDFALNVFFLNHFHHNLKYFFLFFLDDHIRWRCRIGVGWQSRSFFRRHCLQVLFYLSAYLFSKLFYFSWKWSSDLFNIFLFTLWNTFRILYGIILIKIFWKDDSQTLLFFKCSTTKQELEKHFEFIWWRKNAQLLGFGKKTKT